MSVPPDKKKEPLYDLLCDVAETGDGAQIKMGDALEELESRGFGPLLFVPSFLGILLGGVPFLNYLCATLIILVAGQILIGRDHPWFPEPIRRLTFSRRKFRKAVDASHPTLHVIETLTKKRLSFLTTGMAQWIVALISVLLSITVYPLDLLPFAAAIPCIAILFFALGLMLKDGLVMAIGFLVAGTAGWLTLETLL